MPGWRMDCATSSCVTSTSPALTRSGAPLSSGLDIVRKTLGQHEIATVQTTAIDTAAGIVNLTTMLAHASGEWIASDWPVCPLADMASPQRMGTALTYARRYALFTLVGIAGEDDLDAPGLCCAPPASTAPSATSAGGCAFKTSGQSRTPQRISGNGGGQSFVKYKAVAILEAEQSAALREKLLTGIAKITSAEIAATWAHNALGR